MSNILLAKPSLVSKGIKLPLTGNMYICMDNEIVEHNTLCREPQWLASSSQSHDTQVESDDR